MVGQLLDNVKNLNLPNILALFRIALSTFDALVFIDRANPLFTSWHPSWFDYFAGLILLLHLLQISLTAI